MKRNADKSGRRSTRGRAGRWIGLPAFTALGRLLGASLVSCLFCLPAAAASLPVAAEFRKDIQPLLQEYCYDCHGDGAKKGNVAFDELNSEELAQHPDLWLKVLKNVRAGLMPPQNKARPSLGEQLKLEHWIKYSAFGIDPVNPDPGRVTIRRLNRIEYRNTIRDLTGYDFKVEDELPPDDTGYGFDTMATS